MKEIILNLVKQFINFSVIIWIIIWIILSLLVTFSNFNNEGVLYGILILVIGFFSTIFGYYLFYTIINFNDCQISMTKSLEIIANSMAGEILNTEESNLKCPNCNTSYSAGDKFCENCGTKLD